MPDDGIGATFEIPIPIAITMSSFVAIALYNVLELTVMIFATFKRRSGLYFWSLVAATLSLVLYSLAFTFKFFNVMKPSMILVTMGFSGWFLMVNTQSLVLYSRLHLVLRNDKILRWVLGMIIVDAIICGVPIGVLAYGSYSSNPTTFVAIYSVYEKVEVTIMFIQEATISGIYLWETIRILRDPAKRRGNDPRTVMKNLIYMNVFIIILDLPLLSTEYAGFYDIQTTYKAALYSVKLKVEFAVLNQLLEFVTQSRQVDLVTLTPYPESTTVIVSEMA
jgi:hypothetical protein